MPEEPGPLPNQDPTPEAEPPTSSREMAHVVARVVYAAVYAFHDGTGDHELPTWDRMPPESQMRFVKTVDDRLGYLTSGRRLTEPGERDPKENFYMGMSAVLLDAIVTAVHDYTWMRMTVGALEDITNLMGAVGATDGQ